MTDRAPGVLFLCTHNAGRSQMAMGLLRHLAGDRARVYCAGSEPADEVDPAAIKAMAEKGIDISDGRPKRWTTDMVEAVDVVVTMGCGDQCPYLPGKRYENWELADPAGRGVEAVRPDSRRGEETGTDAARRTRDTPDPSADLGVARRTTRSGGCRGRD